MMEKHPENRNSFELKHHTHNWVHRCKKDLQWNHHKTASPPDDNTKMHTIFWTTQLLAASKLSWKPRNAVAKLAITQIRHANIQPSGTPYASWLEDQQQAVIIYEFLMISWAWSVQMTINKHHFLDSVQLQQGSGPESTKNHWNGAKSSTSLQDLQLFYSEKLTKKLLNTASNGKRQSNQRGCCGRLLQKLSAVILVVQQQYFVVPVRSASLTWMPVKKKCRHNFCCQDTGSRFTKATFNKNDLYQGATTERSGRKP